MTTMNQKMMVYTVLAIALGYFLTSAVPATLTPSEGEFLMRGEGDSILSAPQPESSIEEPELDIVQEKFAWNEAFQYSILVVDFLIAFGIYVVAKRRLG
jgi:hypothetical protein